MLEDLGNCVKIHDTVIPAVNIQVEGYPKWDSDLQLWFGIYFEILFEDGTLWEVEQSWVEDEVFISKYPNWGKVDHEDYHQYYTGVEGATVRQPLKNWDHFQLIYQIELQLIDIRRRNIWCPDNYNELMRN